jgi:hypothetical protein
MASANVETRCRYCGCTESRACVFNDNGIPRACWWVTKERDVCSAPLCFRRYLGEVRAAKIKSNRAA